MRLQCCCAETQCTWNCGTAPCFPVLFSNTTKASCKRAWKKNTTVQPFQSFFEPHYESEASCKTWQKWETYARKVVNCPCSLPHRAFLASFLGQHAALPGLNMDPKNAKRN